MNINSNGFFPDWKIHQQYIDLLSQVNNSCVFLMGHVFVEGIWMSKFIYLSPNFITFFGFDPQRIAPSNLDVDFLYKQIHPNDLPIFKIFHERLQHYIYQQSKETYNDYKNIFEFRAIKGNGEIIRVISQHQGIDVDDGGLPKYTIGVIDISPDQFPNEVVKFKLINTKTGEVVNLPLIDPEINLSKREKEILKLMNEGLLSKEISDKLFISVHTVNGHRQKILQKMSADNTPEAINYARRLGILD